MHQPRQFGLIGYPLSHSFSKKYFSEKFEKEGITNCSYDLFPIKTIEDLPSLLQMHPNLKGLNVTIPYKQAVIPFLDKLDDAAAAVGAVNTIKIDGNQKIGFNTDIYGFEVSLQKLIKAKYGNSNSLKAFILGTGGAAKAVYYILKKLQITPTFISRTRQSGQLSYADISEAMIRQHLIIINTTPLGMYPNIDAVPNLPYTSISTEHLLYDLVYNPEVTAFLQRGLQQGATIKNGLEMLVLQAEKAWTIWNKNI